MKEKLISICIPTYEMGGEGTFRLQHLLESIKSQTYRNYEVVISDHSLDDEIENLCKGWDKVRYFRNTKHRGISSSNLNNAIKQARGEYIKPMFQDDFFYSKKSLSSFFEEITKGVKWVSSAYIHFNGTQFYDPKQSSFHSEIHLGRNTIGMPSGVMFRRDLEILFDENLIWLMDVDFYKRYQMKWGDPGICRETLVVFSTGGHQVSHTLTTEDIKQREYDYVVEKYRDVKEEVKVDYILSSTYKWYKQTLPIVIDSLLKSGISPEHIRVYVSNSPQEGVELYRECYLKFVLHNSFDYTSFIEYVDEERPGVEFFFSLHDTCEVDVDFRKKVESFNRDFDAVYLTDSFRGICNFGMHRKSLLKEKYKEVKSLKNCSKTRGVQVEGFMFRGTNCYCYPGEEIVVTPGSPYKGGTNRICEYYKHVGLKKYKANWEPKINWNYEL